MSLYHEYRSCCSKKDDRKKDDRVEAAAECNCFCDKKFINSLRGQTVTITTVGGSVFTGRIVCFDPDTCLITISITVAGLTPVTAIGDVVTLCCRNIESIIDPVPAAAAAL